MVKVVKKTKEQIIKETQEGFYGDYSIEQLKNEIPSLLKQLDDHVQAKKDYVHTYGELISDVKDKIVYCVARIDHLQHEQQVAVVLENASN